MQTAATRRSCRSPRCRRCWGSRSPRSARGNVATGSPCPPERRANTVGTPSTRSISCAGCATRSPGVTTPGEAVDVVRRSSHRRPTADRAARPVPRRLDASGPVAAARDPHRGHRTARRRAHDPRRGPARDARDGQPLESGGVRHRARAPRHRGGPRLARPSVGHGAAGVPPLPPDPGLRTEGPAHDRPGVLRRRARPSRLVGPHAGSRSRRSPRWSPRCAPPRRVARW